MKAPPSDRQRDIARRLAQGVTMRAVAKEFKVQPRVVSAAALKVKRYDTGMEILREDPSSLAGLELIGVVPTLVRQSLAERQIWHLEGLEGIGIVELLKMPNIGRRAVTILFELMAQRKSEAARRG